MVRNIKEEENENVKRTVINFRANQLEIDDDKIPEIQSAYRFGKGSHRPIAFKLKDQTQSAIIFSHLSKLKGKLNDKETPFYVDEQLTERGMENRRRQRRIRKQNRDMPMSHRLDINYRRGELMIEGRKYEKMIDPPDCKTGSIGYQ